MSSPKPFVSDNFMKIVLKLKEQGSEVCCIYTYKACPKKYIRFDNKHAHMNKYRHQIK